MAVDFWLQTIPAFIYLNIIFIAIYKTALEEKELRHKYGKPFGTGKDGVLLTIIFWALINIGIGWVCLLKSE
jgi:hypothetical protein